jgi:hypothetical protein
VNDYALLLAYDRDTEDFAFGFEAGRIWMRARYGPEDGFDEIVHFRNSEMMIRIAEATGRSIRMTYPDDHWAHVYFGEINE